MYEDLAAPRKKQKQATQKKWLRVSVSLKVFHSNDGH